MRRLARWLRVGMILGLVAGCGGGDGSDNITGNYQGTIQDNLAGAGSVSATLAQTGSGVTGTFQTTFPAAALMGGGSVSGTLNGAALTLTVTPSRANACPSTVTATVAGDEINGNFATFNCTGTETGTFTITKQ